MNADFYDMSNGAPLGAFAMEGNIYNPANNRAFFAVLKDGTPYIGFNNTDWESVKGQVRDAVGGADILIRDSQNVAADWSGGANARTAIGITADQKVIMLVIDGKPTDAQLGEAGVTYWYTETGRQRKCFPGW